MTDTRRHLLTRCLRLELRIEQLEREIATLRPKRRTLTDADRTMISALHQQGKLVRAIATQTGWSIGTVYNVINAPFAERAVGE